MTRRYRLESALLASGWARNVDVTVDDRGIIGRIEAAGSDLPPPGPAAPGPAAPGPAAPDPAAPGDERAPERVGGFVVPGMPNAHSHAFQRAMCGNTEYRSSARDSFWTWREAMYALANRITPEDLELLAGQLFVEMLKAGYTSVAEFHYLHRPIEGGLRAGPNALWEAVTRGAETAGIGLTLLPTLYQTSDFGARPLKPEQARFELQTGQFVRAIEARVDAERRLGPVARRTGAAFHSLRAVPLESLREALAALRSIDPGMPVHIHVAEQRAEVQASVRSTGRRPIELLLHSGLMDAHWCLVHATHATPAELQGIARSGAAVCVSITTEANLGDGFFDAARHLQAGGRLCVGSDSQATVCPAEELRWMEYQARLRKRRRAALASREESHVGTRLWREAAQAGALALGQAAGTLGPGARADWLVLDDAHPSMAAATPATALDHLIFAGGSAAIRHVMVAGRWVVRDRCHAAEEALAGPFRSLMSRLALPAP